MKKKLLKNIGIIALALAICFLPQISTFAKCVYNGPITMFTKQYVDSNEWTYVCYAKDSYSCKEVSICIDNIYTASGTDSWYSSVKVRPCFGNDLYEITNLKKNKTIYYTIPTAYRAAGNYYRLFAMGNNPSLDCQITGVFSPN